MSKSWSYAQITRQLEDELLRMTELAAKARAADGDDSTARYYRIRGEGAVHYWYNMTVGWQQGSDHTRLAAMANAISPLAVDID